MRVAREEMEVALKIDIDTHRGLAEGVPRLAQLLGSERIPASFFVAMGPDNSGRAIWRTFKNPGFISKMRRTRAISMYGWRTILSGTILPPRAIALAFPYILRDLIRTGFELGVHGYDHVRWQDQLDQLDESGVNAEIDDAFEVYRAVSGVRPLGFAAPGWRINGAVLRMLDGKTLWYQSNTRGHAPYRCVVDGTILSTPEIPTTLPTMDEVMGSDNLNSAAEIVNFYLGRFSENELNVLTIHAETEGMSQMDTFAGLVRGLRERGARFLQLREVAQRLSKAELPVCEVIRTSLPGRAGWISAQGPIAPVRAQA